MPTPATTHEQPVRRAPKRPWRQFTLPAVLRLPFRIDTRSGPGKALLSFRRGLIAQLGGDLTASQIERIDNACLLKLQLLTADLTARDQAALSATLDDCSAA